MSRLTSDLKLSDTFSARWNQTQADARNIPAPTASDHVRSPQYLSAPDFDANTHARRPVSQANLAAAGRGLAQVAQRFANALPWLVPSSNPRSRALMHAALQADGPDPLRQALVDAQDIKRTAHAVAQTASTRLMSTAQSAVRQVRADPLGSAQQLAWAYGQGWHDLGYETTKLAHEDPAQLLNPLTLGGLVLGGILSTRKVGRLHLVHSQDTPG